MKIEYLVNFSQYFDNFTKSIIWSCNKTFLRKVSKTLAEFDGVFNFGKFLIYVLAKFNRNLICASCFFLYFLKGNLKQNVYNEEFFNVNNEFNVTNVRNLKFLIISYNC